jgi:hypothetical protein
MKTFITAMTLVFALATGTSMMALTVHSDRVHVGQDSPSRAVYQNIKKRLSFIERVQTIP